MRIHIEAGGLTGASDACRTANQISALVCDSLASKLSGFTGMAGDDSTSVEFAATYDVGAREAVETLKDLTHAFIGVGRLLDATSSNHSLAEAASASVTGFSSTSSNDDDFVRVSPSPPPSSLGANAPILGIVETFILDHVEGFVWPGADVELLLDAAATWRRTAESVANLDAHCDLAVTFLERLVSPEIPLAISAFDELRGLIRDTAEQLLAMAASCEEYAEAVRATHQRTLDLLAEIGRMVVEGAAISLIIGGLTGGLGAGAAGTAAIARIAAQAPRFHALLTTLRITGAATATRLRTAREGLGVARARFETFARVRVRSERGEIRLPGVGGRGRTPGWLRAHELPPGHTMSKHVGKTVDELHQRCQAVGIRKASSFANEVEAEHLVDRVLRANADKLGGVMDNLRQLMAAYFHQDWFDEYSGSWEKAVDDFALREPHRVAGARSEIQQLLGSSSTDSDLDSALAALGNYRWPGDAPTAYRDWLRGLSERLGLRPGQDNPSR